MIARRLPLVVLAALALAACGKGMHYPVTPNEAHKRLVKHELPLVMFGGNAAETKLVSASNDKVVWAVTDDEDNELLRLAANIAPESDGSRITTEVIAPMGLYHDRIAKGLAEKTSITDVYRAVADEQVASSMADRKFNYDAINPALMKAAFDIVPEMRREAMDQASEAQRMRKRAAEQAEDVSARYREKAGAPDPTYGRPMDEQQKAYGEEY